MSDRTEHLNDQPAVSSNNTGSRHAGPSWPLTRGNRSNGLRDGLSRRLSGATPSRPAADRLLEKRHLAQIRIAWACAAGLVLTALARCAYPPPTTPTLQPTTQDTRTMDDADRAQARSESDLARRLAVRTRYRGTSATHCTDCDDPIPERRRELIAGCTRCASCQGSAEKRGQA